MFTRRAMLRLGVLAFLLVTFLGPIGAGAQSGLSCDDFNDPDAAQYLLDLNDSYADDLDPDGDGIACNEDVAGEENDPLSPSDYVYAVWDEVDAGTESVMGFLDQLAADADAGLDVTNQDAIDPALLAVAGSWLDYPDRAPEFDAPAGYEDIDALYRTWVVTIGDLGITWQAFMDLPASSSAAEDREALDEFGAVLDVFGPATDELVDTLAAAEEAFLNDDAPDGESRDEDADAELSAGDYLAAVDEHFNALVDSYQDFTDLIDSGNITEDDQETLFAIYETWASAADVAAAIEPPAGYEEIHEAYLEVAGGFTELYAIYTTWIESESGSDEEAEAYDAFQAQADELNDLCIAFDELLTGASN